MRVAAVRQFSKLSHPQLLLQHKPRGVERDRGMYILERVAPRDRSLMVNDASISTMACALLERMYYCNVDGAFVPPPEPQISHVFSVLGKFRTHLLRYTGRYSKRVSTEQFVLMCPPRKRAVYERAEEEFHKRGVGRKDAESIMFVKMEKVNPEKAPRCIQPRSPVYNIALGTYIKPVEHKIYECIQRVFESKTPVVMKHMNVSEMGCHIATKWQSFNNPVAVGLDATKFDMHVSVAMLKWEHSVYNSMFGRDPELARLLSWQVHNRGKGYAHDGKLTYKVSGRRFSGDMNTSLGNCLIMCAMIYTWCRRKKVTVEVANNGDDAVCIMNRRDLDQFQTGLREWFLELGFRMVVEKPVYTLEQIEFCQMKPVQTPQGYRMCRNFKTCREKDSICLLRISTEVEWRKWLGAVGECGLSLTSGLPVFQSFYQAYIRAGLPSKMRNALIMQTGMELMSVGMTSVVAPISDESRLSFMDAFELTPDEQVSLEAYYDSLDLRFGSIEACDKLIDIAYSPY